jgi:CRP-like cAMP-binding protein
MPDRSAVLSRLPLFARLDARSLEAVAALAREVRAPAGTVLMREGDPTVSFYVIVSGTVHVERDGGLLRSMGDGGFLGEIGLLEARERTATVTCASDCELLELGGFEFERVMATFPDVRARVEAAVGRRPHADPPGDPGPPGTRG